MSGLRDRMNRLRGASGTELPAAAELEERMDENTEAEDAAAASDTATEEEAERLGPEWNELGVAISTNAHGSFLLRRIQYDASFRHGIHAMEEWPIAAPFLSAFYPAERLHEETVLFLDLETTGLGVGAGNVPFMIGLAYWKDGAVTVEQALIRHPAEERAMLAYLQSLAASFTHLVTYNGKSFDWPLMQSRFIMNGMGSSIWQPLHLDFLHPARSVWRNTLTSCRLSHVEEMRLGITRIDDVPGSLAPQLYFQFLAEGDPNVLAGVYRHNETDMLSLVCLAIRFGHLLSDRDVRSYVQHPTEPEEMVRTGLWLEKMGKCSYSEELFQLAEHMDSAAAPTLLMLAARDKKAGNWTRAVLLWQKVVNQMSKYAASALHEAAVELSMYYEHKLKDYESALHYATIASDRALAQLQLQRRDKKSRNELDELNKRISRLEGKLSRC